MKFHQKLALLAVLIFSISCTREKEKPVAANESDPAPGIVFSKELDFPRVYSLLTGRATDQRVAARAIVGQYVDWDVYVIGPYEWGGPSRVELLKKSSSSFSEDDLRRAQQWDEHPQLYLIAPSSKENTGVVMRAGDGFKGKDFGRIVSGFASGQKLRAKGRIVIGGGASDAALVQLAVYEISAFNMP